MESESVTPELLRLSSTSLSPLEYFTDSTNTINHQSDVILIVGKEKFYCHRLLLSLVSPVFQRMFDGQFKEHNEREIVLEGKSSEAILDLLKYIYPQFNGQITDDNIENFLQLADEYMIEHLKKPCKDLLIKQLQLFKFVALPTQQKLEQPSTKSKSFHASDSALDTPRTNDDSVLTRRTPGNSHGMHRPASSSRPHASKSTSSYLKSGDKSGSSSNTHPRYVLFLDKIRMPTFYDTNNTRILFTNNELEIWLRRLRILYQVDKGRNYGEIIDHILSILQFIPANLLLPRTHITMDTYSVDEIMLNDIARARMYMLEDWATDGQPHRSVNLTESYRTFSPTALIFNQQTTTTANEEPPSQTTIIRTLDYEEETLSSDSDTD
ncbi:unnamed protein product [Adineta steineri]|uniref:BTB domain-containing protein n=2 Tax=Adineta steineri TaxID=433720 RepID=A0A813PM36_9BILA|nr:unnamed protein product [Adineta steineri]CAF3931308.1 unnamed protein product [Adineta steineri]